jgi:metallophosphoesterase (TIGR00282 family)
VSELRIAFLGDVVGSPGRRAVAHAWPKLRDLHACHGLIVNAENSRNGSGCSPDNARELWRSGADACTLGDHVYKDRAIAEYLEDPLKPISRPANLSLGAPGKRILKLELNERAPKSPPIYVLTVLGRLYMPLLSNSPFEAIDRELGAIPEKDALVIVEVHAEATSEKQAVAWHCLEKWTKPDAPKVVGVVGTHTHVQTADARLIDHTLSAITDLGMCGPHRSVIGRDVNATLKAMVEQSPAALDVADRDNRATGIIIRIDAPNRRSSGIEMVNIQVPELI